MTAVEGKTSSELLPPAAALPVNVHLEGQHNPQANSPSSPDEAAGDAGLSFCPKLTPPGWSAGFHL